MAGSPKINLSIALLEEGLDPESSLKDKLRLEPYNDIEGAFIIVRPSHSIKPKWAKYINRHDITTSSSSALLFIPSDSRWFTASFGYAYTFLDNSKLVNDFGLRTALNMLDPTKIKSSDILAPSDHSKQRRTQTAQDSSLQGHDIDKFSHIIKNITGKVKPEYEELSKSISASNLSIKITNGKAPLVEDMPKLCLELLQIYQKEDCKDDFPEAFYIRPVSNISTIKELENLMLEALKNIQETILFDVPRIIEFQKIDKYQVNFKDRKRNKNQFDEIPSLNQFLEILKTPISNVTIEDLKSWDFDLLDESGIKKESFSVHQCIVFETKIAENEYYLSDNKWYQIDSNFITDMNNQVENIKTNDIDSRDIIPYSHDNEADYNADLARSLPAILLDKELIRMGNNDKIELCDVLYLGSNAQKNIFIHVKIMHGRSSGLSHLFHQGDVSLTLLNSEDENFIDEINRITKNTYNNLKDKEIHFLIINKRDSIPLFAKIALYRTVRSIKAKGAEVYWSIILKGE